MTIIIFIDFNRVISHKSIGYYEYSKRLNSLKYQKGRAIEFNRTYYKSLGLTVAFPSSQATFSKIELVP
jgi:hypothetical protein